MGSTLTALIFENIHLRISELNVEPIARYSKLCFILNAELNVELTALNIQDAMGSTFSSACRTHSSIFKVCLNFECRAVMIERHSSDIQDVCFRKHS